MKIKVLWGFIGNALLLGAASSKVVAGQVFEKVDDEYGHALIGKGLAEEIIDESLPKSSKPAVPRPRKPAAPKETKPVVPAQPELTPEETKPAAPVQAELTHSDADADADSDADADADADAGAESAGGNA